MNQNVELSEIIKSINAKLDTIYAQLDSAAEIIPHFAAMGDLQPILEDSFSKCDEKFSSCISRVSRLNQIVLDDLLGNYEQIIQNLNVGCGDAIGEALSALKNGVSVKGTSSSGATLTKLGSGNSDLKEMVVGNVIDKLDDSSKLPKLDGSNGIQKLSD